METSLYPNRMACMRGVVFPEFRSSNYKQREAIKIARRWRRNLHGKLYHEDSLERWYHGAQPPARPQKAVCGSQWTCKLSVMIRKVSTSGSLDNWLPVVDESFGDVGFSRLLRVDFTDTAETMEPILNLRSWFGVSGVVGSVRSSWLNEDAGEDGGLCLKLRRYALGAESRASRWRKPCNVLRIVTLMRMHTHTHCWQSLRQAQFWRYSILWRRRWC